MSTAIVTGGAGFIGSHIVDTLLADGFDLHVIDNLSSGRVSNLPSSVTVHKEDIRSAASAQLVRELAPDVVVHAAAQISVRKSLEDPVYDTQVNIVGLVNLLNALGASKLPFFIFLSTGGAIYGEQDVWPAPEDHPIRPTSVYGLAKRVSEMYLDFWARHFNLKYTALRLANVYGPRQNPHGEAGVVAIFTEKLLRKEIPIINGNGNQTRDYVYVEDVARAVHLACEKRLSGIFNIGTATETSVNDLYASLSQVLHSKIKVSYGPAKAGEQQRSCVDSALAKQKLSWEPKMALRQGLELTARWFAEQVS